MAKKSTTARNRSTGKKPSKGKNITRERNSEDEKRKKTITIIMLIATTVLLFALVLISGDKAWYVAHSFLNGVFGGLAIAVPLMLSYTAISNITDKPLYKISVKIILALIFTVLLCTDVFVFSVGNISEKKNYFDLLSSIFKESSNGGGCGLAGGIIGIPFIKYIGATGSRIICVVLSIVSFSLLSLDMIAYIYVKHLQREQGSTDTVEGRSKSRKQNKKDTEAQKAAQRVEKHREELNERNGKKADIDIPLDDEMPLHPVVSKVETEPKESPKLKKLKDGLKSMNKTGQDEVSNVKDVAKAFVDRNRNLHKEKTEDEQIERKSGNAVTTGTESKYIFPSIQLLENTKGISSEDIQEELEENGLMLVDTLKSFGVQTKIVDICRGPAVTRFELQPAAGVKISKITNLADDIALNLAASGVRMEAPIPGKAAVGVEIPNKNVMIVRMKDIITSTKFKKAKSKLTVALGRDITGEIALADLSQMPHLLIAGSTGSGKSVCINSLIISLLYKSNPDEVKLLMVDPKVVELGIYNDIPHLLVPVVTDAKKAAGALSWAVTEMLKRYRIFAECGVRDLQSYNHFTEKVKNGKATYTPKNDEVLEPMPQIVIIIDELSDLMMVSPKEVEDSICRLAQMARAAGMHLIIATQRPSVDVITGIIKANIPSRIAFAVSSQIDSRTILDSGGAEKLLGKGDMLFSPIGISKPQRVQGCFVTDEEIERVTSFVKTMKENNYDETIIEEIERNAIMNKSKSTKQEDELDQEDELFDEAVEFILDSGQASTSMLQRRLRIGYARAGRLIDEMEQKGIVGPHEGSKARKVVISKQQWQVMKSGTTEEKDKNDLDNLEDIDDLLVEGMSKI